MEREEKKLMVQRMTKFLSVKPFSGYADNGVLVRTLERFEEVATSALRDFAEDMDSESKRLAAVAALQGIRDNLTWTELRDFVDFLILWLEDPEYAG